MARRVTTAPIATVGDTVVAMGLSRNGEDGTRRISQGCDGNGDLK